MAMIIKRATVEPDGALIVDVVGAQALVRLWRDTVPPTPTDLFLVVAESTVGMGGESVKPAHRTAVQNKLGEHLTRMQLTIADFGPAKRRGLRADIVVPSAWLDTYTG